MMGWDTPPESPGGSDVARAVGLELEAAAGRLERAMREGSAVRTGRFRGGWSAVADGGAAIASNSTPYADYAPLDTTEADRVASDLSERLGAAIDTTFGLGG